MIEFQNVSKSYWTGTHRKVILANASFRVESGDRLGILAPNGTGKTTIINMMCGLEKPDEGRVVRTSRVSFPLGFSGGLNNKHSAQENSRYIARLYGLDPDYVESFCRYVCDLDEYFEMPISVYSRGMRSRISLAILLALDFDVYLIDEGMPNSTDPSFNRKAGSILIEKLTSSSVVIVSHQQKVIEKFATKGAVLKDGTLHVFDNLQDAIELYDYRASEEDFLFNAED